MFLSEDIDGKIDTHWRPKKQRDDSFEYVQSCIGWWWLLSWLMANIPSSGNCLPFCNHSYITGFYTGTHWKVGWICKWVQKHRTSWIWLILMLRYINFRKADAHYNLMEYATLKKNLGLLRIVWLLMEKRTVWLWWFCSLPQSSYGKMVLQGNSASIRQVYSLWATEWPNNTHTLNTLFAICSAVAEKTRKHNGWMELMV